MPGVRQCSPARRNAPMRLASLGNGSNGHAGASAYDPAANGNGATVLAAPTPNGSGHNAVSSVGSAEGVGAGPVAIFPVHAPTEVFTCPEESLFYSQCIEKLVFNRADPPSTAIEFGAGDGTPVISALLKAPFPGTIHAYELNPTAAKLAGSRAAQFGLHKRYQVHNSCFFEGVKRTPAECIIANPPYLPAPDSDLMMPALHGGYDGSNLTRSLMELGYDRAMLLVAAYSNPVETIRHAQAQGYRVSDFMVTVLPFGVYSSEPKVRQHIELLKSRNQAWCTGRAYLLAGLMLEQGPGEDLADELVSVMTAL